MADYNIQMKQFNGNDYDNLYPATLASLVRYNQDGGIQSTNVQDALKEVNVSRPYIIKGSYVGTGVYGVNNPNTLVFDKEVGFVVIMDSIGGFGSVTGSYYNMSSIIWLGQSVDKSYNDVAYRTFSYSNKTLTWYAYNAETQLNQSGHTYFYFAVAEDAYIPYVGQTWLFIENTTFVVPVTGNYKLELHGGGGGRGGDYYFESGAMYDGGAGGGSGQIYNNIQLTKNQSVSITIGNGGAQGTNGSSRYDRPATNGSQGGTTTFGSYSIAGGYGGGAAQSYGHGTGGSASGNIATAGSYTYESGVYQPIAGKGGSQYGNYGNGQAYSGGGVSSGISGVVILTYLGG